MNLDHRNFGQSYRLSHLAIRLRTFTARELAGLTGMVEDTVYGFLAKLTGTGHLQWEELPRSTRGRPVKRYTLTEEGLEYLLQRNARLASILRGEDVVVPSMETSAEPAAASAVKTAEASTPAYAARMAQLYREVVLKEKAIMSKEEPVQAEPTSKYVTSPQYKIASAE